MAKISPKLDRLVNVIVCSGAAIVIFGAWQKITHQPMADLFLTIGLLTESVIFIVYAILPPPTMETVQKQEFVAPSLPKMGEVNVLPDVNSSAVVSDQMAQLGKNLTELNKVYGGMLTAMHDCLDSHNSSK